MNYQSIDDLEARIEANYEATLESVCDEYVQGAVALYLFHCKSMGIVNGKAVLLSEIEEGTFYDRLIAPFTESKDLENGLKQSLVMFHKTALKELD